jgi:hypothetical protein
MMKAVQSLLIVASLGVAAMALPSHTTVRQPHTRWRFAKGTTTVIDVGTDRVILASDSRVTLPNGYRDDDCKISAYDGELIFSGAGYRNISSSMPSRTWDAHDQALQSFQIAKASHTTDVVSATAREWETETKQFFSGPPAALQDLLDSGFHKIFDALFVGQDNGGRLVAIHDQLRIEAPGPRAQVTSEILSAPMIRAFGVSDVAEEFEKQTSPSSVAAVKKWRESVSGKSQRDQDISFASQLVRWTIQYGPDNVGGAVDSVVLDSAGIHWVARKPICKDGP